MATTQQDNDEDNATNDCPICLCPLSSPWGVTSCGHAYCRDCWDQLAANHVARRNNGSSRPSCAICKTVSIYFTTVFGVNVASAAAGASTGGITNNDAVDADAAHDMLGTCNDDEEDKLWEELETLHPEIITTGESRDDEDDNSDNSTSVWDNGQREVAAICANFIDLTQNDNQDNNNESASPIEKQKQEKETLPEKEQRTHSILRKLQQLRSERMLLPPRANNNMSTQQTQKLRSEMIKLKSANADLTSQLESQKVEMESLRETLITRSVEAERERSKANKIASEFNLMEESYQKDMSKKTLEQNALKSENRRLKDQLVKITNKSEILESQEAEEVRRKYSKMSQEVHSLRTENRRLADELAKCRRESEREKAKLIDSVGGKSKGLSSGLASAGGRHSAGSKEDYDGKIKRRKVDPFAGPSKEFSFPTVPPRHKSKSSDSSHMDILNNTKSRKHSLQQNLLMMPFKRRKR